MTLVDHGLIEDCAYRHPWTQDQGPRNPDRKRRSDRKNSQSTCYWLLYKPFLDGTLMDVEEEIRTNKAKWYDFLDQMFETFNILKKQGYSQNDYSPLNIMFKKIKGKYQWYLIDYGQIWHKKYPLSQLDKDLVKRDGSRRNNDALNFTVMFNPIRNYVRKYNLHMSPQHVFEKRAFNTDEFKQLKKYNFPDKSDKFIVKLLKSIHPRKALKLAGVDNTKPWHYLPIPFEKIEKSIKYHN